MMSPRSVQSLMAALHDSWRKETSFTPLEWTAQNPARGHCLVSTLVVQDYFGGDIRRYDVKAGGFSETHYCNLLPEGATLDVTAMQYSQAVQLSATPILLKGYRTVRERYLADPDTRAKYELLRDRVAFALSAWGDEA